MGLLVEIAVLDQEANQIMGPSAELPGLACPSLYQRRSEPSSSFQSAGTPADGHYRPESFFGASAIEKKSLPLSLPPFLNQAAAASFGGAAFGPKKPPPNEAGTDIVGSGEEDNRRRSKRVRRPALEPEFTPRNKGTTAIVPSRNVDKRRQFKRARVVRDIETIEVATGGKLRDRKLRLTEKREPLEGSVRRFVARVRHVQGKPRKLNLKSLRI